MSDTNNYTMEERIIVSVGIHELSYHSAIMMAQNNSVWHFLEILWDDSIKSKSRHLFKVIIGFIALLTYRTRYFELRWSFTCRPVWWPGNRFLNEFAPLASDWWFSSSWLIFYATHCEESMFPSQKCLFLRDFLSKYLSKIDPYLFHCPHCLRIFVGPNTDNNTLLYDQAWMMEQCIVVSVWTSTFFHDQAWTMMFQRPGPKCKVCHYYKKCVFVNSAFQLPKSTHTYAFIDINQYW
jgi:hypothetical protein